MTYSKYSVNLLAVRILIISRDERECFEMPSYLNKGYDTNMVFRGSKPVG